MTETHNPTCNKCSQPLQPWEVTICEPCQLAADHFQKFSEFFPITVDTNRNTDDNPDVGRKGRTTKTIKQGAKQ